MDTATHLLDKSTEELEALLHDWGQPAFRARQIYRQIYTNLAESPAAMSDLPLALRERLTTETTLHRLRLLQVQKADNGLTRKALFTLSDGSVVESVLMVYADRATVCVSTQAGCAMGCVFCATGKLGLLRNLSAGEIVEQVLWASRELRSMGAVGAANNAGLIEHPEAAQETTGRRSYQRVSNVVFMGMGEPFANYERWWSAVERLHDPTGFGMGARAMTVSTVGLAKGIRQLADAPLPINLAISLHAPNDALRTELMPVNQRYPLAALFDATRYYMERTRRRVSFEYVLLQGRNDEPQHALQLADLLRGAGDADALPLHLLHVNLIPWNPVPGMPLGRSERRRVLAALGATLILTPGSEGMNGAIRRAETIAASEPQRW
ncbi:23S rRNA (adenine(2503)-C(2))-methyltransferase RlmN, partial [Candidatus Gracilibacteria bacterium]|nr:23S rRNA (adenine(2503)-C(2))-methyltransferase RlmN [Candidatus Gracilibacteria bacterium]